MIKLPSYFLPAVVAGVASLLTFGAAKADTIFVSNNNSNTIEEIFSNGTTTTFASTNLVNPTGLAFDGSGNLFVTSNSASGNAGDIVEFNPDGSYKQTFATGLQFPRGLAFSGGDLYVANQATGTIDKILPNGSLSQFASGLSSPNDLAFDSAGNLYVTNGTGASVTMITPGGVATPFTLTSGSHPLHSPNGIAIDSAGNIFVVNNADPSIEKIIPTGLGSGVGAGSVYKDIVSDPSLNRPKGLTFDSAGDLYVTDYGDSMIVEYDSTGTIIASYNLGSSGPYYLTTIPGGNSLSVPEPSTYALLTAGAVLLYFMRRRKLVRARI